jgi:hypothetical protein
MFHHNLIACNTGRNPSIAMTYDFNFVNNVIFNWRHRTVDGGGELSLINMINNYYKPGPVTPDSDVRHRVVEPAQSWSKSDPVARWGKVYASGNFIEGDPQVTADNWDGGIQFHESADLDTDGSNPQGEIQDPAMIKTIIAKVKVDQPFQMAPVRIQSAQDAYTTVVANAGATLPKRDPVDERVVKEVTTGITWGMGQDIPMKPMKGLAKNNIGDAGNGIITDISQVGGFPEYKGEPVSYPQHDGIPDWWKKKYGLDLSDPNLASEDCNGDGYTNIEKYLDGLDPTQKVDWHDPANDVDHLTEATLTGESNK